MPCMMLVPLAAVLILFMAWQQFSAESLRGLHELRWASLLSGGTFGGVTMGTGGGYHDDEKLGVVIDASGRVSSIETRTLTR